MRRPAAALVLLASFLVAGCDLFRTRDPQPPTQGSSNFETPTTYDKVLKNLVFAISDKNVNNYLSCFVDTTFRPYVFLAAEDARRGYPDVMNNWNLEGEQRYFTNLREATPEVPVLTLPDKPPTYVSSDSVVYGLDYTLSWPHIRAGIPTVVQGSMRLAVCTDGKRWAIYYWRDSKTTADSTWSYLKAVFSGG